MIVSETSNRSSSRWLLACVLLLAAVVLPLGVGCAPATNYEAVSARLDAAVAAGELTADQAGEMMAALDHSTVAEQMGVTDGMEIGARLETVGTRLKAAAEAGEMTEEEAWAKWHAFKEHDIAPRLKAAVKAGEMTEREAWGIWCGIEKAEIGERLRAAVAKGEMTEEEARAKWAEISRERGRERGRDEMAAVGTKIRAAVAAGEMTPEQGRERMAALRKRMAAGRSRQDAARERADAHFREVWAKLQAEVKAGNMTAEEAEAKMAAIKRDAARRRRDSGRDQGIAGHYKRLGVSDEMLGRIKKALADSGVKPEQMADTLGGMVRVIHEAKSEGDAFELDPRLKGYFKERVALTDEQIELVQKLAGQVADGMKDSDR